MPLLFQSAGPPASRGQSTPASAASAPSYAVGDVFESQFDAGGAGRHARRRGFRESRGRYAAIIRVSGRVGQAAGVVREIAALVWLRAGGDRLANHDVLAALPQQADDGGR